LTEAGEHHEVDVERDAGEAASAERRQPVLVLEPAEFALDGGAPVVRATASALSR